MTNKLVLLHNYSERVVQLGWSPWVLWQSLLMFTDAGTEQSQEGRSNASWVGHDAEQWVNAALGLKCIGLSMYSNQNQSMLFIHSLYLNCRNINRFSFVFICHLVVINTYYILICQQYTTQSSFKIFHVNCLYKIHNFIPICIFHNMDDWCCL